MTDKSVAAIHFVLANEGGYSNDVFDSGGATNYGISLRFLREVPAQNLKKYGIFKASIYLLPSDIEELTLDQAILIYTGEFWNQAPFEQINMQSTCSYVFDMCVNHGTFYGIKILQHAIWTMHQKRDYDGIIDDGILGPKTIAETNYIDTQASVGTFNTVLASERCGYMRLLAALEPKNKEFLNGWLDRCMRIG
jgi:lysozyme family protein